MPINETENKMVNKCDWMDKLKCPGCGSTIFRSRPGKNVWGSSGITCSKCRAFYPVKGGILEMLPEGDYGKYSYWDKNYADASGIISSYEMRFKYTDKFLLNYYIMPALALKLGWNENDMIELGCGWGTNALAMSKFGITSETWILDISMPALKGAVKVHAHFGKKVFPVRADIHRLPFKDNAFGISISGGLYEHFVGEEQAALVRENSRISRKVLCQVPSDTPIYWIYRWMITLMNKGKWPFGFENPIKREKLASLYSACGVKITGYDYGNLATAAIVGAADVNPGFGKFDMKPFFYRFFEHEFVLSGEKPSKKAHK